MIGTHEHHVFKRIFAAARQPVNVVAVTQKTAVFAFWVPAAKLASPVIKKLKLSREVRVSPGRLSKQILLPFLRHAGLFFLN